MTSSSYPKKRMRQLTSQIVAQRECQILTLIEQNPGITYKQLALVLGVSRSWVTVIVSEFTKIGEVYVRKHPRSQENQLFLAPCEPIRRWFQ